MSESELFRAPLGQDLRPLSALLWQQRIAHRIAEEGGQQVLRLADTAEHAKADALLQRWRSGELRIELRPAARVRQSGALPAVLKDAPVTALLIAFAVAGFLVIYLGAPISWVAQLSYAPFSVENGSIAFSAVNGEPWRFVTPVFLHFGWLHITFNSLWCWELGRKIESTLGSVNLFGLTIVIAALSNAAQWQFSPAVLFGGLSGVVYGFLGFAWVAGKLNPAWHELAPSRPIMLFMVGWLLICVVGVVNVLGFAVANAAHVGGLLSGAALGGAFAIARRAQR